MFQQDDFKNLASAFDLITVLGATASGKTAFAVELAWLLGREVISADSRQIYKRMDIGTGKDIGDYMVQGTKIPVHLIDILEPGEKYTVYHFQQDFYRVFSQLKLSGKSAIMCGGSGMYIESVIKAYEMLAVPINLELRNVLEQKDKDELILMLQSYKTLHNVSDINDKKRLIRAIEIAVYSNDHRIEIPGPLTINHLVLGIKFDRDSRRRRISERLKHRLENGMVEEVQSLIQSGIDTETLIYYGLEYKFITLYLTGKITYPEMYAQLETAIHQFSKRQMTWFRKMERDGIKIHWLDGYMSMDQKMERVYQVLIKSGQNPKN